MAAFARLLVAVDARVGRNTSLAASAAWEQSPFRRDSLGDEAEAAIVFSLGLSRRFGDHVAVSLGFLENVPRLGDDTDFSLALAFRVVP